MIKALLADFNENQVGFGCGTDVEMLFIFYPGLVPRQDVGAVDGRFAIHNVDKLDMTGGAVKLHILVCREGLTVDRGPGVEFYHALNVFI